MTEDLDTTVTALQRQIRDAQGRRATAEARVAVAEDRVAQALAALREEFGIEPDQAPARLEELRADLAAEAERVREALERAEASE